MACIEKEQNRKKGGTNRGEKWKTPYSIYPDKTKLEQQQNTNFLLLSFEHN